MLRKDLDGDGAIEAGVARSIDLTAPTGARGGDALVGSESRASRQSHIEARKTDRFAPDQSGGSNTSQGTRRGRRGECDIIRSPSPTCLQDWGGLQRTPEHSRGQQVDNKATNY